MFARLLCAECVSFTSAELVLKALDNIYKSLNTPATQMSVNWPPFNSQQFVEFSNTWGISFNNKTCSYHLPANPVKIWGHWTKPWKYLPKPKQRVCTNELLASYQATPQPATNHTPSSSRIVIIINILHSSHPTLIIKMKLIN